MFYPPCSPLSAGFSDNLKAISPTPVSESWPTLTQGGLYTTSYLKTPQTGDSSCLFCNLNAKYSLQHLPPTTPFSVPIVLWVNFIDSHRPDTSQLSFCQLHLHSKLPRQQTLLAWVITQKGTCKQEVCAHWITLLTSLPRVLSHLLSIPFVSFLFSSFAQTNEPVRRSPDTLECQVGVYLTFLF